jgi:hypothetical protein
MHECLDSILVNSKLLTIISFDLDVVTQRNNSTQISYTSGLFIDVIDFIAIDNESSFQEYISWNWKRDPINSNTNSWLNNKSAANIWLHSNFTTRPDLLHHSSTISPFGRSKRISNFHSSSDSERRTYVYSNVYSSNPNRSDGDTNQCSQFWHINAHERSTDSVIAIDCNINRSISSSADISSK